MQIGCARTPPVGRDESADPPVAPPAVFHDLRLSYGSLLLNAGADAEVIQELLGHADLRMTRRAYAHLLNATVAKTVRSSRASVRSEAMFAERSELALTAVPFTKKSGRRDLIQANKKWTRLDIGRESISR